MKSKLLTTVLLAPLAALLVVACERDFATEQSQLAALGVTQQETVCDFTGSSGPKLPKEKTMDIDGDGVDEIIVTGTRFADVINCSAATSRVIVTGGFGDDVIIGSDFDDVVTAGGDNDWVRGGLGNDDLSGGHDCDRVDGQDGDDVEVDGGPGNDDDSCSFVNPAGEEVPGGVFGGDGNDLLNGGPGDDDLDGGAGNDTLNGNNGADSLNGGADTDTCNGGKGADTFDSCETENDPDPDDL